MYHGRKVIRECGYCKQEFEARLIRVRAGGALYCSKKCYHDDLRSKKLFTDKELNVFYQIKYKYGLSREEYLELFNKQDNKCDICKKPLEGIKACVDHSHDNGKIRGILCNNCNNGIGFFGDNIELLETAIEYIKKHNGSFA